MAGALNYFVQGQAFGLFRPFVLNIQIFQIGLQRGEAIQVASRYVEIHLTSLFGRGAGGTNHLRCWAPALESLIKPPLRLDQDAPPAVLFQQPGQRPVNRIISADFDEETLMPAAKKMPHEDILKSGETHAS